MGSLHLRVLRMLDGVAEVILVEPDDERRTSLEARYRDLRTYVDVETAVSREALDFACVAVPVAEAPEVASRLIEHRVPVLLEKPMAPSLEEASALASLASDSQVLLSIGYVERFNPAIRALREQLARGAAGAVYQMHARRLSPLPDRGGLAGVALDLATHELDVMRFLSASEPLRVYAETGGVKGAAREDLVCASLRFESGTTGLIEANWLTPMKVRQLSVTTESGMFVADYLTQDLYLYEQPQSESEWETLGVMRGANEGRMIRFALHRREPLAVEWEQFLGAVASEGEAPVAPQEGVAALAAARAIIASGQSNMPVSLAEVGVSGKNREPSQASQVKGH
jgi:UDP-N-acetylglucosamine 3-dehydrogenase